MFSLSWVKWGAIAVVVLALIGVSYKLYTTIKEIGTYQYQIQLLEKSVEDRQKQIAALQQMVELQGKAVEERDQVVRELEQQIDALTDDLGPDASDDAAESLKELFRRLERVK